MVYMIALSVGCVLFSYGWVFGADFNPKWSVDFDEDIKWYQVTPPGHVVVGTKHEIKTLDPETGMIAWGKPCRKKVKWGCFEPIYGTSLAVLTMEKKVFDDKPRVSLIDVTTGGEIWNSTAFGLGESYGHLLLPPLNALMFYGKQSEKPKKKFVVVVELVSGEVLWQQQEMFKKWDPHLFEIGDRGTIAGNQEPLFDTDSTMVLFLNKKSLRKYHLRTGELIWESTGKLKRRKSLLESSEKKDQPCSGLNLGYAPMILSQDSAIIYAPYQNTVGAFRTEDGQTLWKKPDKLAGIAVDIIETEHGLLVKTWDGSNSELKMLDFSTGKKIWMAPKKEGSIIKKALSTVWSETSNMILEDSAIYITSNTDLYRVDPSTGKHEKITSLGFEGIEDYLFIEPREEGHFISGLQNLAWFSPSWERQNNVYYRPADNVSGGLLSLATTIAFEAIGTRNLGGGFTMTFSGDIWGAAETLFEDYSATSESDNYLLMLAEPLDGEHEGLCLLRVSKTDGAVENRIKLKTREPDYQFNFYQNSLVMKPGKKQLVSYQF